MKNAYPMIIPWTCAVLFLVIFNLYIQFPIENAFIQGVDYFKKKQFNSAMKSFNDVLDMDPNFASAYLNRGYCYVVLGNPALAMNDYQQGIKLFYTSSRDRTLAGRITRYVGIIPLNTALRSHNQVIVDRLMLTHVRNIFSKLLP